jgi:membrane-bound serine protease (ClpP class)
VTGRPPGAFRFASPLTLAAATLVLAVQPAAALHKKPATPSTPPAHKTAAPTSSSTPAKPAGSAPTAPGSSTGESSGAPQGEALVYTITLDDIVHPISASYLHDALKRADHEGAALVIVRLDTPGGLMSSMEEMITDITHARAPVVVFVHGSKAASAGFFLTIAADVAVMAPGTRIGAAHPVMIGGGDLPKDSPMMEKIENDAAAYARSLATNRGRNAVQAEKAVRESLAFTEQEALKLGLIDFICHDEAEILKVLDGRTVKRFSGQSTTLHLEQTRTVSLDMSRSERFLSLLANPVLSSMLLFLGLVCLYLEFTHPGLIAPGVIGGLCLLLFVLSTRALPVNWAGVALVAAGVVLFLLEIKMGSHGILTAGGIACLVVGAFILFPKSPDLPGVRAAQIGILGIAAGAGTVMAILTTLVRRVWRIRPMTGSSGLIDERGTALTDLDPTGRVFVHGESWSARASRPLPKGTAVRVRGVHDLVLDVEEAGP